MALFRHFFYPRIVKDRWLGGCVTFVFLQKIKPSYPLMKTKSRWEEWRHRWFLVEISGALPQWEEPKELPEKLET